MNLDKFFQEYIELKIRRPGSKELAPPVLVRVRAKDGTERVEVIGTVNQSGGVCGCCDILRDNDEVLEYSDGALERWRQP